METILPIVNGSFNPRFLPHNFKELGSIEEKQQALWYLVCSFNTKDSFPGVEDVVFAGIVPKPNLPIESHSLIVKQSEEELGKLFEQTMVIRELYNKNLLTTTHQRSREKGQQIYRLQQKLGFGGFLEMDLYRLKGYMEERGEWNDFNPAKISQQLNPIEKACPRKDYGVNNPSTGLPMHTYRTVHGCEYVNMYFPFVDHKNRERVEKFYKEVLEPKTEEVKADNCRIEINEDGPYASIELIWWWD